MRVAGEIHAGLVEVQSGDLDASAEQRHDPQPRSHIGSAKQGLGAERGVVVDDQVFEFKAGAREKTKMDGTNLNSAPQRLADGLGSLAAQAVGARPYQEQGEQQPVQTINNHAPGQQGLHRTALSVLFQRVWSKK